MNHLTTLKALILVFALSNNSFATPFDPASLAAEATSSFPSILVTQAGRWGESLQDLMDSFVHVDTAAITASLNAAAEEMLKDFVHVDSQEATRAVVDECISEFVLVNGPSWFERLQGGAGGYVSAMLGGTSNIAKSAALSFLKQRGGRLLGQHKKQLIFLAAAGCVATLGTQILVSTAAAAAVYAVMNQYKTNTPALDRKTEESTEPADLL